MMEKNIPSRGNDDDENNIDDTTTTNGGSRISSTIDSWAPITTRLLLQGGPSAWNVLDDCIPSSSHTNNNNFVTELQTELEQYGWIQKLKPAKTNGEVRVQHLLSNIFFGSMSSSLQQSQPAVVNKLLPTSKNIRGDQITFIGRDLLRQRQKQQQRCTSDSGTSTESSSSSSSSFDIQYPNLSLLINSVERTVQHNLCCSDNNAEEEKEKQKFLEIDTDMTSVQLAMFPGDGKSGYTRHCDREKNKCQDEEDTKIITISNDNQQQTTTTTTTTEATGSSSSAERVITAVYYLTPEDWDVEQDGGCLRIYGRKKKKNGSRDNDDANKEEEGDSHRDDKNNNSNDPFFDVAPYRNRLIVFRSDGVEHEVLPSLRRPRLALTIWLYGRVVVQQQPEPSSKLLFNPTSMKTPSSSSSAIISNTSKSDGSSSSNNKSAAAIITTPQPSTTTEDDDAITTTTTKKKDKNTKINNKNSNYSDNYPPPLPIQNDNNKQLEQQQQQHSKEQNSTEYYYDSQLPSIFVTIASYRDFEIGPTIQSIKETAYKSERVYIGLVLQIDTTTATTTNKKKNDKGPTADDDWNTIQTRLQQQQQDNDDDDWYQSHVRCMTLDAKDATGPCYARMLGQTLFRNEDYVLQTDSHMRFRYNWDQYLIEKLDELEQQHDDEAEETNNHNDTSVQSHGHDDDANQKKKKFMLTTYPAGYTLPNNIPKNETRGTMLVPWKFDADGLLRQKGTVFRHDDNYNNTINDNEANNKDTDGHDKSTTIGNNNNNNNPLAHRHRRHYLYAGGFNFARSRVMQDCPYDGTNNTHFLFFGEELSMAVRLYTHGYDLYAPAETVCYHLWSRNHRPTLILDCNQKEEKNPSPKQQEPPKQEFQNRKRQQQREKAIQFVKQQLYGHQDCIGTYYGLGTLRTAQQFHEAIGVDFENKKILHNTPNRNNNQEAWKVLEPLLLFAEDDNGATAAKDEKIQSSSLLPLEKITQQSNADDSRKILQVMSSFLEQMYVVEQQKKQQDDNEEKSNNNSSDNSTTTEAETTTTTAAATKTTPAETTTTTTTTTNHDTNHHQDIHHHIDFHTDMVWSLLSKQQQQQQHS